MLKLIWAEIKKIFLNRKTMIGIFSALILIIGFFTYGYWESNRYLLADRNLNIPSNDLKYLNQNGADIIPGILADMDYKKNSIIDMVEGINAYVNKNTKELVKNSFNKLTDYNTEYRQLIDGMIPYNLNSETTLQDLKDVFGERGQDKNNIESFLALFDKIDNELIFIEQWISYVFFKQPTNYEQSFDYLYNFLLKENFYLERLRVENFGNNLEYFFDTCAQAEDASVYDDLIANSETINAYINNVPNILGVNYLNDIKNLIDESLGFLITSQMYNDLRNFIYEDENSAIKRLESYRAEAAAFESISALTNTDSNELSLNINRFDNMVYSLSNYIEKYIKYNSFLQYSDNVLSDYVINNFEKKYNLKKYITAAEYIVKNNMHFADCYNGYAEGYASPKQPLSLGGIITGMMYNPGVSSIHIFSYIQYAFSILSLVIITICVLLGGGSIAGEQSSGTIKMLMIRPYKRWKILTSKILCTLIVSLVLIIFSVLLLFALGLLIGFDTSPYTVMAVVNASNVIFMSPMGELLLQLLFMFLSLIIYTIIATLFSAVLKAKTGAVLIALLLNFIGTILGFTMGNNPAFKYFIFSNSDLYMYFGNGPLFNDMTLGFSLIVCALYTGIFGFLTYYLFAKKDLN
jgi:ABC-2 type transport system permease protein